MGIRFECDNKIGETTKYKKVESRKVNHNLMNMLKPTFRPDSSLKDKKNLDSASHVKQSQQQNISTLSTPYKPRTKIFTQGIGLSLKDIENREISVPTFQPVDSQENLDGYLQKVIRSNLEKISQIRNEHEKEKNELLKEVMTLKSENTILRCRLEEHIKSSELQKLVKVKELSSSLEKKNITKFATEKTFSPNPEKTQEKNDIIAEMKEKTDRLVNEIEEFKKRNAILSVEKRTLTSSIERLQKEIHLKNNELELVKKHEFEVALELKDTKHHLDNLKRQIEVDRFNFEKEIEKIKINKEKFQEKEKEKEKITSIYVVNHEINPKIMNDPRITGFVDRRVVKHLECQLKEKDSQIHLKDQLINDLNDKILSNGLSGLNTKYKYLAKA